MFYFKAIEFCNWLSEKEGIPQDQWCLLGDYAWYSATSGEEHMFPVGLLRPNNFGLFDTLGNASELCNDLAGNYDTDIELVSDVEQVENDRLFESNPRRVSKNDRRMVRGGNFFSLDFLVRSAQRDENFANAEINGLGFRVARTITFKK